MMFIRFIFVLGCTGSRLAAAVSVKIDAQGSTMGASKEKLMRSESRRAQNVRKRSAHDTMQLFADIGMHKPLLETLVGLPPGIRTLVLTRRDENATKIASAHNAFDALGIDFVQQPCPATIDNVSSEMLATAAVPRLFKHGAMVALAHMRALQKASEFEEPWTLIMEDDARPLPIAKNMWLAGFNAAWKRILMRDVAMVRLGWCEFEPSEPEVEFVGNGIQLVHHINVKAHTEEEQIDEGECLTAYIVNKQYISSFLEVFPVDTSIDVAWRNRLLDDPSFSSKVYSITHEDAVAMYKGWAKFDQHGLIAQDQRDFPRPAQG